MWTWMKLLLKKKSEQGLHDLLIVTVIVILNIPSTLLHPEQPKPYRVLAVLGAIGLISK